MAHIGDHAAIKKVNYPAPHWGRSLTRPTGGGANNGLPPIFETTGEIIEIQTALDRPTKVVERS